MHTLTRQKIVKRQTKPKPIQHGVERKAKEQNYCVQWKIYTYIHNMPVRWQSHQQRSRRISYIHAQHCEYCTTYKRASCDSSSKSGNRITDYNQFVCLLFAPHESVDRNCSIASDIATVCYYVFFIFFCHERNSSALT